MTKEKLFFIGVKALIEDESGSILLLEEETSKHSVPTDPYWDLPGGRIDVGENPAIALEREMYEETGITSFSEPEFFTAVISNHQIKIKDGYKAGLALFIYKTQVPSSTKIKISDEQSGYEWVDKKVATKRLADKYPPEFTNLL